MCCKPVSGNRRIGILRELFHFIGKGMCDDIECPVLIVGIDIAHTWHTALHGCQRDNAVLAKTFSHNLFCFHFGFSLLGKVFSFFSV